MNAADFSMNFFPVTLLGSLPFQEVLEGAFGFSLHTFMSFANYQFMSPFQVGKLYHISLALLLQRGL